MKSKLLLGVAPLLAAAALLSLPQTSEAQGFSFGGRNFGVTIGRPYYGYGYYPGGYGYNSSWYGAYPYASRYSWGGGYYPYRSYYYGSPYSGTQYYYPSYSSPTVAYSYPAAASYQSFYPQANAETEQNAARLRLRVPENARVWFDDTETQQRGLDRDFVSPPLTPGKTYVYQIKAQWQENGQDVTRQQQVTVRAGDTLNLDLMAEAAHQRDAAAAPNQNNIPRDRDATAGDRPAADPAQPAEPERPRDNPAAAPDR